MSKFADADANADAEVVSINEAVDIAKKFSTDDSGKFVNGILDKLATQINRPPRTAKEAD